MNIHIIYSDFINTVRIAFANKIVNKISATNYELFKVG